tara:strand:- start:308 stop:1837 length:1530 start_codon:yes stop_codon:yes gene_type:complete
VGSNPTLDIKRRKNYWGQKEQFFLHLFQGDNMNGTLEQINIWKAIEETDDHIFVYAGAGTGKTYTIVEGAKLVENAAFLCFNKSIANELKERLPANTYAATFHSLGFAAFRQNSPVKVKVNNNKVRDIIEAKHGRVSFSWPLSKLISQMKGAMIEPTDIRSIKKLIDTYNIEFEEGDEVKAIKDIPRVMKQCLHEMHHVDFDDMIWIPIMMDWPMKTYDVLFVDEAQDFNEMQRRLILKCVNGGRCIVVGDPNQAIYGFRGADSNSMDIFRQQLENKERDVCQFPLTLSWRCPNNVVSEANRYVKDFYAKEDAADGNVKVGATFKPKDEDMVLCRYNAPLIGAFYELISQQKKARILGRDMSKGLTNWVKKISRDNSLDVRKFKRLLHIDFKSNYDKLVKNEKLNQANNLEDKYECLSIISDNCLNVGEIINEIKTIFDNQKEGVVLSTVHKAKGLEANDVYILATDRMPHPKATNMEEERNICYVAITRAKENLYYCGPKPTGGRYGC